MDLIKFLNARLDEDEAAAKAAASVAGPGWKAETYWPRDEGRTRTCVRSETGAFLADFDDAPDYPDLATHIARHDPGRVLREVEAKRAIVRRYERESGSGLPGRRVALDILSGALRDLAAVYSEHPDPHVVS